MSPSASPAGRRLRFVLLLAACAVHAVLAGLELWPSPREPVGDELRYLERARQLAAGQTPAPDLLWPPLYGRFLALFAGLGGAQRAGVILAQLALLALCALLLRDLTRRWAGDDLAADLAAFLLFAAPPFAAYAYYLWPEVLHLALFLGCLWILAARRESWRWQPVLGFLLGLALLTKSLLTGFVPVLLAPLLCLRPWRRTVAGVAVVLGTCLLTVLPVVLSNGQKTGSFAIADSSRFNLWVGLNDPRRDSAADRRLASAYTEFEAAGRTHAERNRAFEAKIAAYLAEKGWLATLSDQIGKQPFRLLSRHSTFTDQLPGGRLAERGRGYQLEASTFTASLRSACWLLHAALLALAPLGFLLHPIRKRPWSWLLIAFVLYNAALFLGLHVTSRYLFQLLPVIVVGASLAVGALLAGRAQLAGLSRARLAWGLLLGTALVLWSW